MPWLLTVVYAATPPVALALAIVRSRRRRRTGPLARFAVACVAGLAMAGTMLVVNATAYGGSVQGIEMVRSAWLYIAAMCIIGWTGRLLMIGLCRLLRVRAGGAAPAAPPAQDAAAGASQAESPPPPPAPEPVVNGRRGAVAFFMQRVLMLSLAVPYLLTLAILYRPALERTVAAPAGALSGALQTVSFRSTDGVKLAGWWAATDDEQPTTVILVPGLGCGRDIFLGGGDAGADGLMSALSAAGYNVLAVDPRAAGESRGLFASLGAAGGADVLGAVRWVRAHAPAQSQRIFVIGVNTGAVAALAAAADPAGGDITGLALIEPYSDLGEVVGSNIATFFPRPVPWIVRTVAVPMASAHTGENLMALAPADLAEKLWPRPVLVVHGRDQSFVSVRQSLEVYRHCPIDAQQFFAADNYEARRRAMAAAAHEDGGYVVPEAKTILRDLAGTSADALPRDSGVQARILRFLRQARPVPVI